MRSNTWRALILFSLTLMLVSTAMDAQAARRSSLAGNQFINDPDDMFAFPQLTLQYKNRVIIDMAPNSGYYNEDFEWVDLPQQGNGSIVFGDNFVWNFNTGRSDYLNNTASWAYGMGDRYGSYTMFGVPNNPILAGMLSELEDEFPGVTLSQGNAVEWWDLGMATHLGDTPFGFNISWASGKDEVTAPGGELDVEDSTSMLSFQVGATLGSVELAGEVGFGSHERKIGSAVPEEPNLDYSMFNFSLLGRGKIDDFGGLDWRWIAAFTSGSHDFDEADENFSTTAFRGSFGPVWGTPGEWEAAAYMNFDYAKTSFGGDTYGSGINFPGYNLALEYYLNSWLVSRGGVKSAYSMVTASVEVTDGAVEAKTKVSSFMWTLGLGVDKGNWGLDFALEEDNVHSGYIAFNGDQEEHPIAYLTAWLAW